MARILLILSIAVTSSWAKCWWTTCEADQWLEKGCGRHNATEKNKEYCYHFREGHKYHCCDKESEVDPPTMYSTTSRPRTGKGFVASITADCWWTGCQPYDWKETGCGVWNMREKEKEPCDVDGRVGHKYHCCDKMPGEIDPPTSPPTTSNPGPGEGFVTFEQFMEAIISNKYPEPSFEQYNNFNGYIRNQGRVTTLEEAAMCLAQLIHESGGLQYKKEIDCQNRLCTEYSDPKCDAPGQYYYGRGYIQLTWCDNYELASKTIYGDRRLADDPDQVANNDTLSWRTSFWYWSRFVHDAPGVQLGRFGASTKAINGRLECSHPGNVKAQRRFEIYGKVRAAFGLDGPGDPSGCA